MRCHIILLACIYTRFPHNLKVACAFGVSCGADFDAMVSVMQNCVWCFDVMKEEDVITDGSARLMAWLACCWRIDFFQQNLTKVKVKVYIYSPDIPIGSAGFTLITPRYWNSLFHSLISQGKMQRNFLQLQPFTQYQFSLYLVPITAGWTEAVWIQSFLHMTGTEGIER